MGSNSENIQNQIPSSQRLAYYQIDRILLEEDKAFRDGKLTSAQFDAWKLAIRDLLCRATNVGTAALQISLVIQAQQLDLQTNIPADTLATYVIECINALSKATGPHRMNRYGALSDAH